MFFSTKTITVEFGCSKADRPKMLADPSADIVFAYTYMQQIKTDHGFRFLYLKGLQNSDCQSVIQDRLALTNVRKELPVHFGLLKL